MRLLWQSGTALITLACFAGAAQVRGEEHGPAWLDATYAPRALKWASEQSNRTLAALRTDSRFATFEQEAAAILTDQSRPGEIQFIGSDAYQYWQDRASPLGIWRRTPKPSYLAGAPAWETVIDFDALAAAEGKKWIFAGASCRGRRCLVRLSVNGKDSAETREFDLDAKRFVPGGFRVADSKSRSWWYDDDTLLVAPVLGRDSVNSSLVPKTLRTWKRGTPLAATRPIYSIDDHDAMFSVSLVRAGGSDGFVVARHSDWETREYRLMTLDGASRPLHLPRFASMQGVFAGKLLLRLNREWHSDGKTAVLPSGALVAIPLAPLMAEARVSDVELVYRPTGDDAIRGVVNAGDRVFVELLHDYYSRYVEVRPRAGGSGWAERVLPLPSGRYMTTLGYEDGKLLLTAEAPLVPESILFVDPATGADRMVFQRAAQFDAGALVTDTYRTASSDGTTLAYTITRPRDMKLDGSSPTLIYAYGGYDVPVTPRYEPVFGKLWMERGGVYVHAYLRGGGEHGPEWHRGAMRSNRQQPFEDMAAILRDLQRRGVTTPARTGIMGRSNGGLMVATVMEQVPELLNAVVVGGPLIDMLNFHQLPPGGTWLAEYGDPEIPDQRAFLRTYSPMQNIDPANRRYPVPLIITSTDDDRVLPGHARRFAALLTKNGHDNLYFEDKQGGHYWELSGGPAPGDWRLRATARAVEFTYLWRQLGGELKQ